MEEKSKEELIGLVEEYKRLYEEEQSNRMDLEESLQDLVNESRGLQMLLEEEKSTKERLKVDNEKLKKQIEILRQQERKERVETNQGLQDQISVLQDTLERELTEKKKITDEKDKLYNELEDLSQSLFEESNRLVSEEARKCFMLSQSKTKLEHELEELRKRLEIEDQVNQGLKKRLLVLSRRNTALRRATRSSSFNSTRSKSNSLAGEIPETISPTISRVDSNNIGSDLNNSFEWNELDEQDIFGVEDLQRILSEEDIEEEENPLKMTVHLLDEMNATNLKEFEEFVENIFKFPIQGNSKSVLVGAMGLRILKFDLAPCLYFRGYQKKISKKVFKEQFLRTLDSSIVNNKCFIERTSAVSESMSACYLCLKSSICKFRIHFPTVNNKKNVESNVDLERTEWKSICTYCRERVVSVADFYTFLRNVKNGIMKAPIVDMYNKCMNLRVKMGVARLLSS